MCSRYRKRCRQGSQLHGQPSSVDHRRIGQEEAKHANPRSDHPELLIVCVFKPPKIPAQPQPAQMQATQLPKDMIQGRDDRRALMRRRGMWSALFTSPQGLKTAPTTTGGSGSVTGA